MSQLGFSKKEHLTGETRIKKLLSEGDSFVVYPLRIVFTKRLAVQKEANVRVLFSVPKKRFKHAVDRNKIKRQLRESYRKNKSTLFENINNNNKALDIAVLYISNDFYRFESLNKKTQEALTKITNKLE
ncbi:MAG: ribonuclease P protein component [Paludibacteraceae bacterium]|nr:ribonuclease P protein component [Paludibacteraceae bacterium]MBO7315653.1 ribonuclease P protein component [Paludibacteraceae bacterium]